MCGKLNKSMYGTRDAAQNWEHEYCSFFTSIGFVSGKSSACIFVHESRNVRVVIHGDDLAVLAWDEELDWFEEEIQKRYEIKMMGRLGNDGGGIESVRLLNRIITWNGHEVTVEADPRHQEIIVQELKLQKESKGVLTPGVKKGETSRHCN